MRTSNKRFFSTNFLNLPQPIDIKLCRPQEAESCYENAAKSAKTWLESSIVKNNIEPEKNLFDTKLCILVIVWMDVLYVCMSVCM